MRDQFGMYRIQWDGAIGIEYHLSHGDWIALLRKHGFEIEALHELRPHEEAVDPELLRLRHRRVGAQVACRGDLGGAKDMSMIRLPSWREVLARAVGAAPALGR